MDFLRNIVNYQDVKRTIKNSSSWTGLIVVLSVIVYIVSWSYIDIMRMYSMLGGVFDAGIISLTLNSILFNHSSAYLEFMAGFSLLRIIFSPLILIDGIPGMLVIQEIFLGTPAIILYKIGKLKTGDSTTSMLFAIAYLIYFPLAGVNYYDYHFQAFFIFFFLLGYYAFLSEKYLLSSIFFFLSGSVRFPYFVFPYLFMFIILIQESLNGRNRTDFNRRKFLYASISFIIFFVMLLVTAFLLYRSPYYIDQEKYFFGYFHISSRDFISTLLMNINHKVINIVLLFSPLLFIPFRSPKWLILLIPFAVLSMFNQYGVYTYPDFYHTQYTVTVVPFLFIGLIEGARTIEGDGNEQREVNRNKPKNNIKLSHIISSIKRRREPIAVICTVALFAVIFQPYSPVNPYTTEPFDMNIMNPNMSEYNSYVNIVNLIPRNDPYVIYQNQLPYVDVHDYDLSCLEAFDTAYGYGHNVTYTLENLSTTDRVDYALGYYQGFSSGYSMTMCQSMNYLYSKGNYGVEAYEHGIVLLTRNFTGKPIYYLPMVIEGNTTSFKNTGNVSILIPYSMLIPGFYNITLSSPQGLGNLTVKNIELRGAPFSPTVVNFTSQNLIDKRIFSVEIDHFYGQGYIEFNLPIFQGIMNFSYIVAGQHVYNN